METKKVELGDGEPSPPPKSFIDLRREFADQEWIPSCYMDDGRGGLLLQNNTIVLGVGAGFNYEAVKKMATEHNAKIRSGAAQEVSPPSPEPLCPMCCKPAIMPVPPSELEVRELKAALAKIADEIEHTIFFREIDCVETEPNALKRQIANLVRSKVFRG